MEKEGGLYFWEYIGSKRVVEYLLFERERPGDVIFSWREYLGGNRRG